ncbi:ComE operon protein 1 [Rubripirellula obstinata]|uniref:ComE operon protein 1 n=1 Tax=Rubripirellula obstinata TaxID=406547 RepID=A0A5B1CL93_9BACT|nr:helix-hairpin-helix domain-containing protein [Rubripirellula obstinata]KAA1260104.1 ComE operon protein 1 [Rubripirellula obstinata]
MTQHNDRVEISSGAAIHPASPLQQRSVQSFILAASISACLFIAWNFPTHSSEPRPVITAVEFDLNSASVQELSLVPGIGPKLARRIIENRQRLGDFPTLESLQRVHGIGPRTTTRVATICVVELETPRVASK